jgi:hypothetical protein
MENISQRGATQHEANLVTRHAHAQLLDLLTGYPVSLLQIGPVGARDLGNARTDRVDAAAAGQKGRWQSDSQNGENAS